MSAVDFLIERMEERRDELAVAAGDRTATYGELLEAFFLWRERLAQAQLPPGAVVTVEGDYGVGPIAAFLALADCNAVVVPLSPDSAAHLEQFVELGEAEYRLHPDTDVAPVPTGRRATHAFFGTLRERRAPGLVLFTSGSTGRHKAAVHDLARLLRKFTARRHRGARSSSCSSTTSAASTRCCTRSRTAAR